VEIELIEVGSGEGNLFCMQRGDITLLLKCMEIHSRRGKLLNSMWINVNK
jgi:hypothetical protein